MRDTHQVLRTLGAPAVPQSITVGPDMEITHRSKLEEPIRRAGFGGVLRTFSMPVPTAAAAAGAFLADHPVVWAGAGDENSMFATTFEELVRLTGATPSVVR